MQKKIVIAGNYRQFCDWCQENNVGPSEAVYADSERTLLGLRLRPADIIKTGEYWKSPITDAFLRTRFY